MRFKNLKGKSDFFPYLGSRIYVTDEGIELSNENRQLLWAALNVEWLEIFPQDKELADNVKAMYDQSIGKPKSVEETIPQLPNTVTFLNDSEEETYVLSHGSKHTVPPHQTISLSGSNKELIANCFLNEKLKVIDDTEGVAEKVAPLVAKKKELQEKEKAELKNVPTFAQRPMPQQQISQQEAAQQAGKLANSTNDQSGNNSAMPKNFVNHEQVVSDLTSEIEKGIKPNPPGSDPGNNLRIVS